jgi:hypothetical protein
MLNDLIMPCGKATPLYVAARGREREGKFKVFGDVGSQTSRASCIVMMNNKLYNK